MAQVLPAPPTLPVIKTLEDATRAIKSLQDYADRLRQTVARFLLSAQPANADTSGATLGQLETEVNEVKQALRNLGLLSS